MWTAKSRARYNRSRLRYDAGKKIKGKKRHIGKPSVRIDPSVTGDADGPTFIDCGVREGYVNERIRQLSEAARSADDGNIIYWA